VPSRLLTIRRIASVAAAILVLVACVVVISNLKNRPYQVTADAGNRDAYEVLLPDGSAVTLRKGSTLKYEKQFAERKVVLSGEGFFSVMHDEERPFMVEAGVGFIRVLGTKFNVKAMADKPVELYVEEGRVAFAPVARKFDAKIFSGGQAGQLAQTAQADIERTASPGQNITSWISGKLIFDHASLDHVLADLSRHFSVPMQVADSTLLTCELKADFDHATLENVLETLRFSLNLQIDKSGETYIISGEPCATNIQN
jgi:transmembrane sensor